MFIGREQELKTLNRLYNSNKFEFAVIYGRRRVGKTALIREFIKNKDVIFFTGVETNIKQNLDNFSKCIMEFNTGLSVIYLFRHFNQHWNMYLNCQKKKGLYLLLMNTRMLPGHPKVLLPHYSF